MSFKPMLALDHNKLSKPGEDPAAVPAAMRFPVDVQPKLDGIRIVIKDGQALTRTLKQIPNREIFNALSKPEFEGLDGEIVVGDPRDVDAYRNTTSFAMAIDKTGESWTFWVFDKHDHPGTFTERLAALSDMGLEYRSDVGGLIQQVLTVRASTPLILTATEAACIEQGYEGVITRNPDGRYKYGRGGKSIQELIKVKRFIDFEAEIVGVLEEQYNGNVAVTNALGRTERSTAKDGKTGKGTLGALQVRALNGPCEGQEFKVGTGFNAATRIGLWNSRDKLNGLTIKVKSFPVGVKEKPRFPVFLGFRHKEDM